MVLRTYVNIHFTKNFKISHCALLVMQQIMDKLILLFIIWKLVTFGMRLNMIFSTGKISPVS